MRARVWRNIVVIVLLGYLVAGCKMSNEELGREVRGALQEHFRMDPKLSKYSLDVADLTVINVNGNQYQGIATVIHGGEQHMLPVAITYDGENFIWSLKGESFGFLAQQIFQDSYEETYKAFDEVYEKALKQHEEGIRSYQQRYGNPP